MSLAWSLCRTTLLFATLPGPPKHGRVDEAAFVRTGRDEPRSMRHVPVWCMVCEHQSGLIMIDQRSCDDGRFIKTPCESAFTQVVEKVFISSPLMGCFRRLLCSSANRSQVCLKHGCRPLSESAESCQPSIFSICWYKGIQPRDRSILSCMDTCNANLSERDPQMVFQMCFFLFSTRFRFTKYGHVFIKSIDIPLLNSLHFGV